MARALDTSHPLYESVISLIGVEDDGATVKDFKDAARVCTLQAGAAIESGALGYHIKTSHSGSRSLGVRLSTRVQFHTTAKPNGTLFLVYNGGDCFDTRYSDIGGYSTAARRALVGADTSIQNQGTVCPLASVTDPASVTEVRLATPGNTDLVVGTTPLTGQTQTSIAFVVNGTETRVYLNGVLEGTGGSIGAASDTYGYSSLGGFVGWDYGYAEANLVWAVAFDEGLSSTEIEDLHDSLAPNNVFALVTAGGSGNTITITEQQQYTVHPVGPDGAASVTFAGTYTGADPVSVQIRIVDHVTGEVIHDWQTLATSPTGGVYSGTIDVDRGGWYKAEVRYSDDIATSGTTVMQFGVGLLFAALGQSHLAGFVADGTGTSTNRFVTHNGTAFALASTAGAGRHQMFADLVAVVDCPICLIAKGVAGTRLDYWYADATGPTAEMAAEEAKWAAAGGVLHAFIWWGGDANAIAATPKATYISELESALSYVRNTYGSPCAAVICALGRYGSGIDSVWNAIREAHVTVAAGPNNYLASTIDLEQEADTQHFTVAGETAFGTRLARVLAEVAGDVTTSRGPRITGATQTVADYIDVSLAHDGGTDITPATGITGFVARAGSSDVVVTAARINETTIRLTLDTPQMCSAVRYQYGAYPQITGAVKDNTAIAIPLESQSSDVVVSSMTTLVATGGALASGDAAADVGISLAAAGVMVSTGAGNIAVAVDASAVGVSIANGAAGLTATVTISAAGLAEAAGVAGLTVSSGGELIANGAVVASGTAVLAVTITLQATGSAESGGSAALVGGAAEVTLTGAGYAQALAAGALTVAVELAAVGLVAATGVATISGGVGGMLRVVNGRVTSNRITAGVIGRLS